jgi:lipopolysaccharide/colanic/teichoic acid biosynthesis glycosyltransferase
MKRCFDVVAASLGLVAASPVLVLLMLAVWLQDWRSPLYIAPRARRGGGSFGMIKLRSMVSGADRLGGSSTANTDPRITRLGAGLRRTKLDELPQLWNILRGEMSFVGPRPQTVADAAQYTAAERAMLSVRPGVTDLASIVFADEGSILAGAPDPDLRYNQVIRPWKSRLALLYVERHTLATDLRVLGLTGLALVSRPAALRGVERLLRQWQAPARLVAVARRDQPLPSYPLPGAPEGELVVQSAPE